MSDLETEQEERYFSNKECNKLLHKMIRDMALEGFKPDCIAAPSRGGLVIGVQLSHYFNVPLVVVSVDEHKQPYKDRPLHSLVTLLDRRHKVLVVDEICDKGVTLSNIVETLIQQLEGHVLITFHNTHLKTAALIYNEGEKLFNPDYVGETINKYEDPSWIVFDWEAWW